MAFQKYQAGVEAPHQPSGRGHDRSLEVHPPRTGMTTQTADDNSTDRRSSMTETATPSPSSTPVNVSPSGCGNRTPTRCSIVAKANSSMSKGRELPHTGTDSHSGAGGTLPEREERTHRISSEKSTDYATIPHHRFQWCLREYQPIAPTTPHLQTENHPRAQRSHPSLPLFLDCHNNHSQLDRRNGA